MNVEVAIVDISERGIRVALGDGPAFWLPRSGPGIEWAAPPEIDTVVYVRVPRWLIAKHRQLSEYAYQRAFSLQAPVEHTLKDGTLPMSDTPTGRGALFRVTDKKSDRAPDYRGDLTLPDGTKLELAGWLKEDRNGKRYLSISAKPFQDRREEQRQQPAPANTYATATGRDDRQQRHPDRGGPTFASDEQIPF
jgi:hypothetical protein